MSIVYRSNTADYNSILSHFYKCDKDFIDSLSSRVCIEDFALKLSTKAIFFEAWRFDALVGLIAFYINSDNFAYITHVGVVEECSGQKIASNLMRNFIRYATIENIDHVRLEVDSANQRAINLYNRYGFIQENKEYDSIFMILDLGRKMFNWNKKGLLFSPHGIVNRPWLSEYAQAPATLLFDKFVRVYFSCRPPRDEKGNFVSYSAFVDLDRNDLFNILAVAEQPVLSLGKKGCFDEFGTYPISLLRKNDEVWAYYAGWNRCVSVPFNTAIGLGISKDGGVTFDRIGDGPILSYSLDEPFILSGPKIRRFNDKFYLFYISGRKWVLADGVAEFSSKIRVAISDDGINWKKYGENIISDVLGCDESQASPDVIYKNGKYHMFFCHWNPQDFRKTKYRNIGYASSTDLLHWTRTDSKAGINLGEEGDFDSEMLAYPHVFEVDDKIYMLYLGNQVGRFGFGLAELEGELA